jgi:hypothetical protein
LAGGKFKRQSINPRSIVATLIGRRSRGFSAKGKSFVSGRERTVSGLNLAGGEESVEAVPQFGVSIDWHLPTAIVAALAVLALNVWPHFVTTVTFALRSPPPRFRPPAGGGSPRDADLSSPTFGEISLTTRLTVRYALEK